MTRKKANNEAREFNRREAMGYLAWIGGGLGLAAVSCGSSTDSGPLGAAGTLGGAGAGGGAGLPDCVLIPTATEGPFFVDENLNRSDLLVGETDPNTTSGYPIELALTIVGVSGNACQPLQGAHVDIWHANTTGLYSDEPANFIQSTSTEGKKYLRGYQVTDAAGNVRFRTIFPGWYASRTIHIHVKIRMYSAAGDKTFEATTQLYFSDATNDRVLTLPAYASRGPRSIPLNTNDEVYNATGPGRAIDTVGLPAGEKPPGDQALLSLDSFDTAGAATRFNIGVQLS